MNKIVRMFNFFAMMSSLIQEQQAKSYMDSSFKSWFMIAILIYLYFATSLESISIPLYFTRWSFSFDRYGSQNLRTPYMFHNFHSIANIIINDFRAECLQFRGCMNYSRLFTIQSGYFNFRAGVIFNYNILIINWYFLC